MVPILKIHHLFPSISCLNLIWLAGRCGDEPQGHECLGFTAYPFSLLPTIFFDDYADSSWLGPEQRDVVDSDASFFMLA